MALDGKLDGHYEVNPPNTSPDSESSALNLDPFQYNVSIYSNSALSYGQHVVSLTVVPDKNGNNGTSQFVFDYAIYS